MTQLPVVNYRLSTYSQPSFLNTQFHDLFLSHRREISNNLAASSFRSTRPLVRQSHGLISFSSVTLLVSISPSSLNGGVWLYYYD